MSFARSALVNFDESSWRFVMTSGRRVAERGAETVKQYVKACFTFFASILADGTKLPLILLAKGKTQRCHKQFGQHPQYHHEIWHSQSGWCNGVIMEQYLHWLRASVTGPQLVLILDKFEAHERENIYELADALNILLIFIPRGGTGQYQPLDRRVFGALKAKGRARLSTFYAENPGLVCTREQAAGLLLECWAELPESCIQVGWDLDAEGDNQTSSDGDDDGEWELTMEGYTDDREETSDDDEGEPDSDDFEVIEDYQARYGYGVS
jgi:hypothetical protein